MHESGEEPGVLEFVVAGVFVLSIAAGMIGAVFLLADVVTWVIPGAIAAALGIVPPAVGWSLPTPIWTISVLVINLAWAVEHPYRLQIAQKATDSRWRSLGDKG